MTARDQPVRELDHAPDPAEALEVRLDEPETQTPPRTRHHWRGYSARTLTIAGVRTPREALAPQEGTMRRHGMGGAEWAE
jgi:hypothetical protein